MVLGGGLGAQPMMAKIAHEFLAENEIIPYLEATLRVFDRHGERNSRHKARIKFLIQKIGFEALVQFINDEQKALKSKSVVIDTETGKWAVTAEEMPSKTADVSVEQTPAYELWKQRIRLNKSKMVFTEFM